jgi:hypothetical protein
VIECSTQDEKYNASSNLMSTSSSRGTPIIAYDGVMAVRIGPKECYEYYPIQET